jgi:aminopeptidase
VNPDPERFAELLCEWCVAVREGDQVLIGLAPNSLSVVRALHNALLDRSAWPLVRLSPAVFASDFYAHAQPLHLDGFAPLDLIDNEHADAVIGINAPTNTRALAGTDPAAIQRAAKARRPVQEARLKSTRWCSTIWPTPALAQQAGMSDSDYAQFVTRALFLDRPDPVQAWRDLSARQAAIVERLSGAREIRIEADRTDLRLRVEGRTWINSDGKRNMPSGEVFTGPLEDSANGQIRFTIPSNRGGDSVENVELTFEDGKVVAHCAERGGGYLTSALQIDAGASYLGELGIGTNTGIDRATGSTLLDEKIAGTVHLALGRSYPETGGRNVSALHWDLICDLRQGGHLSVDGQILNDTLWSGQ